jgi:hypothetical protein
VLVRQCKLWPSIEDRAASRNLAGESGFDQSCPRLQGCRPALLALSSSRNWPVCKPLTSVLERIGGQQETAILIQFLFSLPLHSLLAITAQNVQLRRKIQPAQGQPSQQDQPRTRKISKSGQKTLIIQEYQRVVTLRRHHHRSLSWEKNTDCSSSSHNHWGPLDSAIVIILRTAEGKPTSNRYIKSKYSSIKLTVTIKSVISLFSTIVKSTLLIPVIAGMDVLR